MFRRRSTVQPPVPSTTDTFLTEAFWIFLGRRPDDGERAVFRTHHGNGGEQLVLDHLIDSPEFHLIVTFWRDDVGIPGDPLAHEEGLRALGAADHFVRLAYRFLLGREADDAGLANYVAVLSAGEARRMVVRTLITSGEFEARYKPILATQGGGYVPRDVQLCELANPAKWDNPDWMRMLKSLLVPHHKLAMHRKSYEWTQLIFGLKRLGKLDETTSVLSVGAGHECVLYWLANHTGRVAATDLYEGRWQSSAGREGDASVVENPEEFAPFPYRKDRLTFHRMDGRALEFPDREFDVVYSLSSIEHFGGFEGARASMVEMTRVLKPGGVLVLATEYIVSGPDYEEAFQPDVFKRLIDVPGLTLVEPFDEFVLRRYDMPVVNLQTHLHQRPHMLVKIDDTVFTSAMVFLRREAVSQPSVSKEVT